MARRSLAHNFQAVWYRAAIMALCWPATPSEVKFAADSRLEGRVHCELVSELGTDSGRVMDDSGTVKRCFPLEFRPKLSSLPWQPAPHFGKLSRCDYERFRRWAPNASMNLPSIKRAGSPHYTVIRLKTSFCSATYRPKAHRPIYRDLGALVHSKYLHHSVQHNALIVGTWSRSSSSGSMGEQQSGAPDASGGTV